MILMNFINRITGHKNKQTAEIKLLQPRLYVIVNNRLNPIYAAVQGGHAVNKWTFEHHDISEAIVNNGYLIYLSGDTYFWKKKLEEMKRDFSYFEEPDLGGMITSISCRDDSGNLFKELHVLHN